MFSMIKAKNWPELEAHDATCLQNWCTEILLLQYLYKMLTLCIYGHDKVHIYCL